MNDIPIGLHDRWLANAKHSFETAYCQNRECVNAEDGVTVEYEEEYGQGSISPEECPLCGSDLAWDKLPEID